MNPWANSVNDRVTPNRTTLTYCGDMFIASSAGTLDKTLPAPCFHQLNSVSMKTTRCWVTSGIEVPKTSIELLMVCVLTKASIALHLLQSTVGLGCYI